MDSSSVGNSSNLVNLKERAAKAARVMHIPLETLWLYLSHLGIEQDHEDGLALLEADTTQEGDARRIMVEEGRGGAEKIGIARFKAGWAVLKGRTETDKICDNSANAQILSLLKTAEHMSDKELIEQYGPDCTSNIVEELKRRSNDRSFVIFLGDYTSYKVDVDNSLKLLRTARRQEIPSTYSIQTSSGNMVVKTYRVGEFPMMFFEECPLHPNITLVNGYCEECQNTWEGIDYDTRVIVRVAKDIGHINPGSIMEISKFVADVSSGIMKDQIMKSPGFMTEFNEMKEENRLPILKRRLSGSDTKSDVYVQRRTY